MGRSQETFNKKEVRNRKEKKRKEKAAKRQAKRENESKQSLDDMIAYVDENGMIVDSQPDHDKTEVKLEDIEISVPKGGSTADEDPIRKGVVTYFNESKGYGFIKEKGSRQDIFVHVNNLVEPVKEGNLVTFEIENGKRGLTAVDVKLNK